MLRIAADAKRISERRAPQNAAIDSIRTYLGPKNAFRNAHFIKGTRPFALYTHQETFLQEMRKAREHGVNTSLVVEPTGTGKSQIAIEDIDQLYREGKIDEYTGSDYTLSPV